MDIILILIGVGILVILVWIVATGQLKSGGPGGAALTSMHDFSPRDKQEAIEIIMEQKAGKRWEEQHSGEGEEDEGPAERIRGRMPREGENRDRAELNKREQDQGQQDQGKQDQGKQDQGKQNRSQQNQGKQNQSEHQNESQ